MSNRNACVSRILAAALSIYVVTVGAKSPRGLRWSCSDVETGEHVDCSLVRLPAGNVAQAPDTPGELQLLSPTLRLRVSDNSNLYLARTIEINVASMKVDKENKVSLYVALIKPLKDGVHPTLNTLRQLDAFAQGGDEDIDKGLALLDRIEGDEIIRSVTGIFDFRLKYYKMKILYNACTRIFYHTCNEAGNSIRTLMEFSKSDTSYFASDRVSSTSLPHDLAQCAAATFIQSKDRADWYKQVGDLEGWRSELDSMDSLLKSGGVSSQSVSYGPQNLADDRKLLQTRLAQTAPER